MASHLAQKKNLVYTLAYKELKILIPMLSQQPPLLPLPSLLQPNQPPCCFWNVQRAHTLHPQAVCIFCFLSLECSSLIAWLTSSLLQGFPNQPVQNNTSHHYILFHYSLLFFCSMPHLLTYDIFTSLCPYFFCHFLQTQQRQRFFFLDCCIHC